MREPSSINEGAVKHQLINQRMSDGFKPVQSGTVEKRASVIDSAFAIVRRDMTVEAYLAPFWLPASLAKASYT